MTLNLVNQLIVNFLKVLIIILVFYLIILATQSVLATITFSPLTRAMTSPGASPASPAALPVCTRVIRHGAPAPIAKPYPDPTRPSRVNWTCDKYTFFVIYYFINQVYARYSVLYSEIHLSTVTRLMPIIIIIVVFVVLKSVFKISKLATNSQLETKFKLNEPK